MIIIGRGEKNKIFLWNLGFLFVYRFKEIEKFYKRYKERILSQLQKSKKVLKEILENYKIDTLNWYHCINLTFSETKKILEIHDIWEFFNKCDFSKNCEFLGILNYEYVLELIENNKIEEYFRESEEEIQTVKKIVKELKDIEKKIKTITKELENINFSTMTITINNKKIIFNKKNIKIELYFITNKNELFIDYNDLFYYIIALWKNFGFEYVEDFFNIIRDEKFEEKIKRKILRKKINSL